MKIVSNDYLCNLPNAKKLAHGGPKVFARHFSEYVAAQGHEWVGLLTGYSKGKKVSVRKEAAVGKRSYYSLFFSSTRYKSLTQAETPIDPREVYANEITRMRRLLCDLKPDIVFVNGFDVFVWILLYAAHAEGIPTVAEHAGIGKMEFIAYSHMSTALGRSILLEMERDLVRLTNKQIFLNQHTLRTFSKEVTPVPRNHQVVIPLPYERSIAAKLQAVPKRRSFAGEIHIGCIARWDRIKNHPAVLNLVREAQIRGLPWEFESMTQIPDTTIDLAFKKEYRERISLRAPMERANVPAFYGEKDAMILTSHFETVGAVVMEAALAGRFTFISPHVGWVDEYKRFGLKDLIIDFSDSKKAVRRMEAVFRHPPSLAAFRRYIVQAHAPERVFPSYLRLFKEVI